MRSSTATAERVAFLGHSFSPDDRALVIAVKRMLRRERIAVITGERPEARGVAEKIRTRIDVADLFVALLTRRYMIEPGRYTTSPWVIEEKGYFLGRGPSRPVLLLVEDGIKVPDETGGIAGDLEYIRFDRFDLDVARQALHEALIQG